MRLVEGDKLIAALTNSWRDEAKRLLLEGWDVDIVDARTRTTPLLLATSLRDFEVVCLILYQSLESVNTKDKLSETALFKAVSRNDPKIAHVLLQAGADVNVVCGYSRDTALVAATRIRSVSCVEILLKHGAEIEHENIRGETALMLSAMYPQETQSFGGPPVTWDSTIFRLLLQAGASVRLDLPKQLAEHGRTDALLLLKAFGKLDINGPLTDRHETALILAALHGHLSLISTLVVCGADIFARDIQGNDALLCACQAATVQKAIIRRLLDLGISPNTRDVEKRTALMHLCCRRYLQVETEQALHLLVEAGATVNSEDTQGRHALIYAANSGNTQALCFLLHKGAAIDHADKYGRTALLNALLAPGHAQLNPTIPPLLAWGCDVNRSDRNGSTALMEAAAGHTLAVFQSLLDVGAAIDAQNSEGYTPLMLAARRGDIWGPQIVLSLLKHGADASLRDRNGATALQHALEIGAMKTKNNNANARCFISFLELLRHQLPVDRKVWLRAKLLYSLPNSTPSLGTVTRELAIKDAAALRTQNKRRRRWQNPPPAAITRSGKLHGRARPREPLE